MAKATPLNPAAFFSGFPFHGVARESALRSKKIFRREIRGLKQMDFCLF
jgi:hypothetical protein